MTETERLRMPHGALARKVRGLVRRVVVSLTTPKALWQFLGYVGAEGDEERFSDVEVFSGVGFYARPRAGKGEAIVASVGGEHDHPVAVATRDASIIPAIDEDETVVFNSLGAKVWIKKDGSIVVRAATGKEVTVDDGSGAVALATRQDVQDLSDYVKKQFDPAGGHTHKAVIPAQPTNIVESTLLSPAVGPVPTTPSPSGTSVLKGK